MNTDFLLIGWAITTLLLLKLGGIGFYLIASMRKDREPIRRVFELYKAFYLILTCGVLLWISLN